MGFYTVVCSTEDTASVNVANLLINKHGFTKVNDYSFRSKDYSYMQLHLTNKILLYADEMDEIYPETGCFIFVSQHKSASNIPTFTFFNDAKTTENITLALLRALPI